MRVWSAALLVVGWGGAVSSHDLLVDGPGDFDGQVLLVGGQVLETSGLFVGQEVFTSMQGTSGRIERLAFTAPVTTCFLLDTLAAPV